jgi:hypothetical protein
MVLAIVCLLHELAVVYHVGLEQQPLRAVAVEDYPPLLSSPRGWKVDVLRLKD